MGFVEAVTAAFKNYVNFSDRACRSAYWWFILFYFLVNLVIAAIESAMGVGPGMGFLSMIFVLVTFLPSLAVAVRRLHDIDKSGWWLLLYFIPLIGVIILIVWACKRGTPGDNRFGPDPLAGLEGAREAL